MRHLHSIWVEYSLTVYLFQSLSLPDPHHSSGRRGGGGKQQQRLRVRKLSSITAYNLNTTSAALNSLSNNFAEWFLRSRVREDGWKTGFVYSRKSYFVAWLLLVVSPLRASPLLPHWLSPWCSPTPSNLLPPLPAPRSFSIYWAGFCFGCRLLTFMSPRWYYTW